MSHKISDYRDFKAHVQQNCKSGQDCEGHARTYVPFFVLQEYWSSQRVQKLLKTLPDSLKLSVEQIRESYLIPFSAIIFISSSRKSYLEEIHSFVYHKLDNHSFPLTKKPHILPNDVWEDLSQSQWQFCPLDLNPKVCFDKRVDPRCIFPGVEYQDDETVGPKQGAQSGGDKATLKFMSLGSSELKGIIGAVSESE